MNEPLQISDLIPPKEAYKALDIAYTSLLYMLKTEKLNGHKIGNVTYIINDEKYREELSKRSEK